MREAMDSSALSEEEEQQEEQRGGAKQSVSKAAAVGNIMEGKRTKKSVERLDLQAPKQREKLRVTDGGGDKLGDIPRINYKITKLKPGDLKPLHAVLFDRPGKRVSLRKNLRLFNGFAFNTDSQQFSKKREKLLKNPHISNSKLKLMCSVLDLEKKGTHSDLVDRILHFLVSPRSSGKVLPMKKKRRSKKNLSGPDSSAQKKKSKPRASSAPRSPKKAKAASKSEAIVMDSSSDEDQEEEEEEEEKPLGSEESKTRTKGPPKKSAAPRKRGRMEEEEEEESPSDSDGERKPKKKKPAAKTKKADSSSHRETAGTEDSSDEDEPLINMIKRAPSDEQLKDTVTRLLDGADLETITMKHILQKVFDTYPEHELSNRKDFIKQTVRALIT